MKKIYLALVCLAGLSIVMACGGKKDSAPKTGNEKVDEIIGGLPHGAHAVGRGQGENRQENAAAAV